MANPRTALSICMLFAILVTPAPVYATASASTSAPATYAAGMEHWTNVQRADRNRVGLGHNHCLERMAAAQAQRIARRGQLFHQDMTKVQQKCGMGYAGENIAYGFPAGRGVVRAWMHSSGHRANILKPQYRLMGAAAVRKNGMWWVSEVYGTRA